MEALYTHYLKEIDQRGLAYLHVMRPFANTMESDVIALAKSVYSGKVIAAGGYDGKSAAMEVQSGRADAVAFGQLYIANPDLAERFRKGARLNKANPDTFYTPGTAGYTDYPAITS